MTLISTSIIPISSKNIFEQGNLVKDRQGCVYMVVRDIDSKTFEGVVMHVNTYMLKTGQCHELNKCLVSQYVGEVTIKAE